jgi:tRNA G18 (ribose-2'-O)-methylase SpoU
VISTVDSISDERVVFYRELKGQHPKLKDAGLVLVEGEAQVAQAKRCGLKFNEIFCERSYLASPLLLDVPQIFVASRDVMEALVGYRLHRGFFALAARPIDTTVSQIEYPAIALNEVTDPENVGTIARSAVAFGFRSIIVDRGSSDPLSRRAIRVSMGSVFALKVCPVCSLADLDPAELIAIECGGQPIGEFSWPENERFILVCGNEKRGVSKSYLKGKVVEVPMERSIIGSINVASAASIVLAAFHNSTHANGD